MNFIFSLDYELFGDGSGNVFKHMIEPTERILNICDSHNIKITIFFEVVEYLRLREEWNKNNRMGYNNNPIEAIDANLKKAAANGHDIQLHIHPQWVKAKYVNHEWKVDFLNWRLGSFQEKRSYNLECLFKEGKNTIEDIVHKVKPNYECIALRAGGYNIMPSKAIYDAMKKAGLKIDSSVYPGGYEIGNLSDYDFRGVENNLDYWWANPADITKKSTNNQEIMEIPIFALFKPRWRKVVNIHRIKSILTDNKSPISSLSKSKITRKSLLGKIGYLLEKEAFTWDYFLFDSGLNNYFLRYIDKYLCDKRDTFVLIGHPKCPFNCNAFKNLIKEIKKRGGEFKTIKQFYEDTMHL